MEGKAGQHTFAISATVEAEGNDTEVPLSTAVTLNMPYSYALPLAEDCEKGTFDTNSLTTYLIEGSSSEILIWNVAGGDYENTTYFASVSSTVQKPWKAALYSRFFDTSDADDVTVSFSSKVAEVNTNYKDFSGEKMAIEYSTDGENWETLATGNVEDMALYISSVSAFYYVAPELGGEIKTDAIVYEDEKEVARETFATTYFTVVNSQTVALDTPVKIEAGKELPYDRNGVVMLLRSPSRYRNICFCK